MEKQTVSRRTILRNGLRSGVGLAAALSLAFAGVDAASAAETARKKTSPIPPNCIYVCCDGTCDSWKMCLKCVEWPKPTTSGTVMR